MSMFSGAHAEIFMTGAAMNKKANWVTAATLLVQFAAVAAWTQSANAAPDLTGVWQIEKPLAELRPGDGSALPLTAWAKELHDKHQALLRKGDHGFDLTMDRCASPGAIRMMTLANPIEFFQRPYQLTMLFEWNHLYRLVNLQQTRKVAQYPMAIGTSNGHWEGETLVIETTDIIDNTLLDSTGLPHSDQLRVVERIRRIGTDRLENVMTLHDPKAFTRDWSVTLTYRNTGARGIEEDVCLDRLEAGKPAINPVR
jgi:hypothetical protein